jgi:hypothetical protein
MPSHNGYAASDTDRAKSLPGSSPSHAPTAASAMPPNRHTIAMTGTLGIGSSPSPLLRWEPVLVVQLVTTDIGMESLVFGECLGDLSSCLVNEHLNHLGRIDALLEAADFK